MEYVTKTVKEIFEALEKNGFEHLRGEWFTSFDEKIGACILGQGAINLGVYAYNPFRDGDSEDDVMYGDTILKEAGASPDNDEVNWDTVRKINEDISYNTIFNQLNKFDVPADSPWFMGDHLAGTIIHWNDKATFNEKTGKDEYYLKTYQEVINMARDLMEPYFDKEVKLAVHTYEMPKVGAI